MMHALAAHLWQSTFFVIAAGLLAFVFRGNRAQVRYWMWLSASLKFLVPFAFLLSLGGVLGTRSAIAHKIATEMTIPAISYTMEEFSEPLFTGNVPVASPASNQIHWIPIALLSAWFCGFLTITLIRFRSCRRIRAAVRAGSPTDIHTAVEVRISPGLLEPGVVGLLRPIPLLPEGITERLTPSELKAVLAHELCHVRRRDNLSAAIHMVVETVFWFHPLVWWIGARLVEERERACDEEVLSAGNAADVYADAILNVCKLYVESPLACVSGVSGASIRRRVEAIMINRRVPGLNHMKRLLLASAGVIALAGPVAVGLIVSVGHMPVIRAQSPAPPVAQPAPTTPVAPIQVAQTRVTPPPPTAPKPKFDVASIRLCGPSDNGPVVPGGRSGGNVSTSPGRLSVHCMSVDTLVRVAYTVDDPLINSNGIADTQPVRGGPAWTHSDVYTIEAETGDAVANGPTAGASPAKKLMTGPMLQTLLEDRFQLKTHREAEEVPMYALTVAKGGVKLKPMEQGCTPPDLIKHVSLSDLALPKPPCNTTMGGRNGPNRVNDLVGTLRWLAQSLSSTVDRHVIDRTGVTDVFKIHLEYLPDENTLQRFPNGAPVAEPASGIPPGPSIFSALEQMGLKLVPAKGPHGYVVIDHVERPSEN